MIFENTPVCETQFSKDDPLQLAMVQFAETMGIPSEGNALTGNFAKWGHTLSDYIREKCEEKAAPEMQESSGPQVPSSHPTRPTLDPPPTRDELSNLYQREGGNMSGRGVGGSEVSSAKSSADLPRTGVLGPDGQQRNNPMTATHQEEPRNKTRLLGEAPAVKIKPLLKPRGGDLRELVLPGGGDLCLRVWAGMRRMLQSLVGWSRNGSTHTTAFKHHLRMIDDFLDRKHFFHQHAWQLLEEREALRVHSEILFVLEDISLHKEINSNDVMKLMGSIIAQAKKRGK